MALGNNFKKSGESTEKEKSQNTTAPSDVQAGDDAMIDVNGLDKIKVSESVRALKALKLAVDNSHSLGIFEPDGTVFDVNDLFLQAYGYADKSEIMGKHHSIFADEATRNSAEYKDLWEAMAKGEVRKNQYKWMTKSGSPSYQFSTYTPVRDIEGNITKVLEIGMDITAYLAERVSDDGLKVTVDTSFAHMRLDNQGNIAAVNKNFASLFGYNTPEEVIGMHHTLFLDTAYRNSVEYHAFWTSLLNGTPQTGQFKRLSKDNREVWLEAAYTPMRNLEGTVVGVIMLGMDVTEQRMVNANYESQLEALGKSAGIVEMTMDGTILSANENYLTSFGYTLDEVKGRHHSIFVEPEFANSFEYKDFWNKMAKGEFVVGEFTGVSKAGQQIALQGTCNPILDMNGNPVKIVQFSSDISQLKNEYREISRIIRNVSAGDLTEEFTMHAVGDIASMGDALNLSIRSLNKILANINQVANLVATSSEELLTKGEQMKSTTQEVASATQQMAEGAQQQAQQTDEASKLMENVLRTSGEMTKRAEIINTSAEKGQRSATEGLNTIRKVVDNMTEIQSSAQHTSQSINVLTERSEEIARTLNVITDIASQTNLLALNAAIEAARAGDAGRGFAVVAEEIRKLAEDSRKSAIDIERVIREVQKDVASAGKAIGNMEVNVKSGNQASREAEQVFQAIEKSSTDTLSLSKEITDSTLVQRDAINTTVKNIEKIVVVAEQTASGTEEVASSTKELSQGMNEVTATSRDLADVATQLLESISKFKLK